MNAPVKPATPLPWRVAENNYGKRAVVSVPVQELAGDKANMWTGRIFVVPKSKNRSQDALYAMHAANTLLRELNEGGKP